MHTQEFINKDTDTPQARFVINFFNYKKNGFFIEMGATDGVLGSNTYLLEKELNWDGILIEPIKEYYDQILNYRKVSHSLNICISETEGQVEFTRIEGYSKALSGISDQYPPEHKDRINREVQSMGQQAHIDTVPSKKLITVLNQCGITHVDYLSIDVEGGEISVLKSLCMEQNSIRPVLIGCENNYKSFEVKYYLNSFGYANIENVGGDDFFYYNS